MLATSNKIRKIVILGASFDTGNLGVSALAWSAIYLIKHRWPAAWVMFLGGREIKTDHVEMKGKIIDIVSYPVRYCKNLLTANHIWKLWIGVVFNQVFGSRLSFINKTQNTLSVILNADLLCDITGGDSFSDIYGMGRLVRGYLLKQICQMTGKPFIMLPQTYGPFKSPLARLLARRVMNKAAIIYSRDKEGLSVVEGLIGKSGKVKLCPDVAFILEPKKPDNYKPITDNHSLMTNNSELIGLNISGLLYSGGYTGKNEFGLKGDYRKLMRDIVEYFTTRKNTKVLLVPHVVPEGWDSENDLIACRKLKEGLSDGIQRNMIIAEPDEGQPFFDQCEIKYLIGQCDFFLGSRMHATIAAISQCIPTVGLAYSRKFAGVYETADVEDCVVDLRSITNDEAMEKIKIIYENRNEIIIRLQRNIQGVKQKVTELFDGYLE